MFTGPLWNLMLKAGSVTNSTVSILKSGDWTFTSSSGAHFGVATDSTVVFTNESGNVNASGGTGEIGQEVSSYAKVVNLSGNWTFNSYLTMAGGTGSTGIVENVSGDWSVGGEMRVASRGYGEFTQYGGSLTVGGDMYISYWASGNGVLTIKGGTVTVPSDKSVKLNYGTGTINLDGGTLVTPQVYRNGGTLTLNFNGGTLKANASADLLATENDNMVVHVNVGGGVIDCGGYAVTLKPKIGSSGDTGSLTFTGGNIITIDNDIYYSGVTYVTPGTTVKATNARISTLLSHGVALVGVTETGTYTVLTSDDDLSGLTLAGNVTCPAASSFDVNFADGGKSIAVTVTALKPGYWTGKAGDNNLSTAGNWSDNIVPQTGNAVIFSVGSVTLTKGGSFAATSITFAEGCSPVTIDGGAISGIAVITNLSSVVQTFANQVTFADTYRVHCNSALVHFAGGATARYPDESITDDTAASHTLKGAFTFTENWTIPLQPSGKPFILAPDSTLDGKVLSATTYNGGQPDLRIDEGAVATFEAVNSSNTLNIWMNGGRLVSTGDFTTLKGDIGYYAHKPNLGTIEANGFYKVDKSGGWISLYVTNFVIGAGGFGMKHMDWAFKFAADSKITAKDDFTIYKPVDGTKDNDWGLILQSHALTIDTAGHNVIFDSYVYNDAGSIVKEGEGELIMQGIRKQYAGGTTVKGGTLTVKRSDTVGTGAMTVKDGATLAVASGATLGSNTVTLEAGSTLALTATGNEFTALTNTLTLPTEGKATLRINGDRLKSGDHILVEGVSAGAESLLNVELAETVKDGRRYDVAVKDGNLVLSFASKGFILIVQ